MLCGLVAIIVVSRMTGHLAPPTPLRPIQSVDGQKPVT